MSLEEREGLPEGWVETELSNIIEVLDSQRIPINSDERNARILGKQADELYPYYGATGKVGVIDGYLFDEPLVLLGEDGVPFLDIARNKAFQVSGKTWVNNHAHVIKAARFVSQNSFLTHYLNVFNYEGYVTGTTRLKLTQEAMRRIPIPLPPLAEQVRIADKLDALLSRVEAGRERLERVPKLVKRFRQSVLSAAVSGELTREWRGGGDAGWEETNLGSLIEFGPKNGLYKHSSAYGTGTKILRIGDFYEGEIVNVNTLKRLKISSLEQEEYSIASEDVIVNRVNSFDYLGKTALVRTLTEPIVFESNMMRIKFNKMKVLPSFCVKYLCSEYGKSQIRRNAKHAVNQASINQSDVKDCQIQLPSLPEQAEIVRQVEALFAIADRLETRHKAASTYFSRLTPALLAKAFRGELVEQDPADEPASVLLERIRAQRAAAGTPAKAGGRGRRPKVLTPEAERGAVAWEPQAARGRGRPRKVAVEAGQAQAAAVPTAGSYEEAVQLLRERGQARAEGARQAELFGEEVGS